MESITNRNKAYQSIIEELSEKRAMVYQAVKELGKCTAQTIAFTLRVPINEVTGRVRELKDRYLIIEDGSTESSRSGKQHTVYRLPSENEVKHALVEDMARLSDIQDGLTLDLKKGLCPTSIELIECKAKKIGEKLKLIDKLLN